ncbi:pleurocidin-like peptide WF3 [Halichoeres trimaculatus]|uniref:pleurocidin-like peptide WF3 n=1 Tax=Halichoeres trimaculatus TaxID=147232 RepID=UPI003D9FAE75
MKFTVLFLVLSMVVLMADPGECIFGHLVSGLFDVGHHIHRMIHGHGVEQQQEQQDQQLYRRGFDYRPGRPAAQ